MAEDTNDSADNKGDEISVELRTEAEGMGWQDKDVYKGDPDHWVPAKDFVEKGRHILPILQKNNERMRQELQQERSERTKLAELLKASQESITALEEYHTEETARQVEAARKNLKAELVRAKTDGNIVAEVELTEELTRLNTADRATTDDKTKGGKGKGTVEEKGTRQELDPEFLSWSKENPWYGTDERMTRMSLVVAEEMRLMGDKRIGPTFLNDVTKETERRLAGKNGAAHSKVEGGRGGGGGGSGTSQKTFADLPADARAACAGYTARLVGPGRRYKTEADWQAAYTKKYLELETQ